MDNDNMNPEDFNQGIDPSKLSEEEIQKMVEAREQEGAQQENTRTNDPYLKSAEQIKNITGQEGLGNVKVMRGQTEGVNSDMLLGWHPVDLENLPSGGRFYPEGIKINIRAAKAAEIRHWSTLNEKNLYDIDDKLNHILNHCTRIQANKKVMSWKDILEEDRIFLILEIRELTFKEGENKLQVQKHCGDCGHKNSIEIKNSNFSLNEPDPEIEKYYDPVQKVFAIHTRSYGVIYMKPPSIGVMQVITKFIQEKQQAGEYWDQSHIQLLPYLQHEWRGFTDKDIFNSEVDFVGWDEKKYMLIYRLAEKVRVGVKPDMTVACESCGAEVTAQVDFQDGIKALFIPTISDISGELL